MSQASLDHGGCSEALLRRISLSYVILAVALTMLPMVSLVLFSFQEARIPRFPITAYSVKWYVAAANDAEFRGGLWTTVQIAVCVSFMSTVLGVAGAHGLRKSKGVSEMVYLGIVSLPFLIPPIVSGLALMVSFERLGLLGGKSRIILAQTCYCAPLSLIMMRLAYRRIDAEILLAAENLGANPWRVLVTVVLPQLRPALLAASLLTFLISWDEFVLAWFVGGFTQTLPTVLYGRFGGAIDPTIYVVGTVTLAVSAVTVVSVLWLFRRQFKAAP